MATKLQHAGGRPPLVAKPQVNADGKSIRAAITRQYPETLAYLAK